MERHVRSVLTGALLDVSGSMQRSFDRQQAASAVHCASKTKWVQSIFKVADQLVKHDVSPTNLVFLGGVGAESQTSVFDILASLETGQRKLEELKERIEELEDEAKRKQQEYKDRILRLNCSPLRNIIDRALSILESSGAPRVRHWGKMDVLMRVLDDRTACVILDALLTDNAFKRAVVDYILPGVCRTQSRLIETTVSFSRFFKPVLKPVNMDIAEAADDEVERVVSKCKSYIQQRIEKEEEEEIRRMENELQPLKDQILVPLTLESVALPGRAHKILHDCNDETELTIIQQRMHNIEKKEEKKRRMKEELERLKHEIFVRRILRMKKEILRMKEELEERLKHKSIVRRILESVALPGRAHKRLHDCSDETELTIIQQRIEEEEEEIRRMENELQPLKDEILVPLTLESVASPGRDHKILHDCSDETQLTIIQQRIEEEVRISWRMEEDLHNLKCVYGILLRLTLESVASPERLHFVETELTHTQQDIEWMEKIRWIILEELQILECKQKILFQLTSVASSERANKILQDHIDETELTIIQQRIEKNEEERWRMKEELQMLKCKQKILLRLTPVASSERANKILHDCSDETELTIIQQMIKKKKEEIWRMEEKLYHLIRMAARNESDASTDRANKILHDHSDETELTILKQRIEKKNKEIRIMEKLYHLILMAARNESDASTYRAHVDDHSDETEAKKSQEIIRKMKENQLQRLKYVYETLESDASPDRAHKILHDHSDETELTDKRITELIDTIEPFIYGGTPLMQALEASVSIFSSKQYEAKFKLLFILSDGEPADGIEKKALIEKQLQGLDVTVVSCFITDRDISDPRRLYSTFDSSWDGPAKFMFDMCSTVSTQKIPRTLFIRKGWTIDTQNNETRLFFQINHPDLIDEVCDIAKSCVCSQDALSDVLSDVNLDLYINRANEGFDPQIQSKLTCYAVASATVMHLSMMRIVGRDGGYPDFFEVRDKIVARFGENRANTVKVLQVVCPEYRLQCKEVDERAALEAVISKRLVVAKFRLTKTEWDKFKQFFKQNPEGILTQADLTDGIGAQTDSKLFGHAVVLLSFDRHSLRLMNSWGSKWADGGFFRVQSAAVLRMKFIDVFWTEEQLSKSERAAFKENGPRVAKKLFASLKGLQTCTYECPLCHKESLVSEFSGHTLEARCSKCDGCFNANLAGSDLALNLYLTSLLYKGHQQTQ